ncbi:hypothetical protein MMC30_003471 [Trapelia coarctata]|nr:hypothetical protein [Trapelia coarctata]
MSPATGGSGSSSDLYSPSDSDDPLFGINIKSRDRLASGKGFRSNGHAAAHKIPPIDNMARTDTPVSLPVQTTKAVEPRDPHGGVPVEPSGHNKRKRDQMNEGQDTIAGRRTHHTVKDSIPTIGHDANPPSTSDSLYSESPIKRSRMTGGSLEVLHEKLVAEEARKPSTRVASLPIEIWQNIFCFVPPVFLGRLLRVNRTFNSLLTPNVSVESSNQGPSTGAAVYQNPLAIWAASRRRFCPGLPKPLHGLNDLEIWRLLRGSDCQLCGDKRVLLTASNAPNQYESGPGKTGVRVIWPFGVRSCGPCLVANSEKELTLFLSSNFPHVLFPALPFAFISPGENFVTSHALKTANGPIEVQLTKVYWKPHIEKIKRQYQEALELGSASAEEWVKGLESKGRELLNDSARWEQWEAKGALAKVNSRPSSKARSSALKQAPVTVSSANIKPAVQTVPGSQASSHSFPPFLPTNGYVSLGQPSSTVTFPLLNPTATPAHGSLPQRPQPPAPQSRPERNIRDVNESKAARRAEIERRCLALDPPLEPNLLCHMESFQAALQISTALTDQAWEVLKPRLLAQRESAERREQERIQQGKLLQAKSDERKHQEAQLKEAKELLDKEWDSVQAPIRDRLATYADEIIHESWVDGSAVTKDTCAKFAADVLLYSRRRFYDDIAEEDKLSHTANGSIRSESPNGPPARKLILENMKWLFDNKVKNFTEQFQKELFLCNGCDGNFKFYGFEGVIQHYAAKHTTALSLGSVVVHWRAEWPEHPPFHPNPSAANAAYYAIPPPMTSSLQPQYSMPPQAAPVFGEYGQTSVPVSQPSRGYRNQLSTESYSSQYPSQFQIGPQYPPPVAAHYPHQPEYQVQSPAFQAGSQFSAPPPETSIGPSNGYRAYPESSGNHVQPTTAPRGDGSYPYALQQAIYPEAYQSSYPGSVYLASQPPSIPPSVATNFSFVSNTGDLYQKDLNEMAQHARDVWFGTSGIKDIPQSVRIYVVVHHVVARFQQSHTNEPSLAMFIDGLDHNPLMRPVRSLNGLACKTCVTYGTSSSAGFHSHPQQTAIDRKLYTLPHLLNHFKSVHVEKVRSTVDLQSGLESSRLDWKRDMIELPEISLIADLVNAPGMDDGKLQLIATVFPGVFPSPLPSMGSARNLGPIPKYGMGFNSSTNTRSNRAIPLEGAQVLSYQAEVPPQKEERVQSRPESTLQLPSPSSARTSEPPGDDEYDPNRPAYYGKIVESRQFVSSKSKASDSLPSPDLYRKGRDAYLGELSRPEGRLSDKSQHQVLAEVKRLFERPYGEPAWRRGQLHGDLRAAEYNIDRDNSPSATSKLERKRSTKQLNDSSRYVSEDGEVIEDPLNTKSIRRSVSRAAGFTAAERFLNDFKPDLNLGRDEPQPVVNESNTRAHSVKQHVTDITGETRFDLGEQPVEMKLRRQNELIADRSLRSTPSLTEARNDENGRYHPPTNGHPRPYDVHPRSSPHIRYSYNEDDRRDGGRSPQAHENRSASHIDYNRPGKVERIIDTSRLIQDPRDWPQTHTVLHRSRSRSPVQPNRGMEHYRTRSPQAALRHSAVYHLDSPSMPPDGRSQQSIRYAYAPEQVDIGGARVQGYPQELYPQRVEYIPIRTGDYGYQEQGRYVVSQPIEQRRMTDRIRYERSYAGEPVYERDGQLYYAEPRQADPRPIRTIPPGYVEYRDNYR